MTSQQLTHQGDIQNKEISSSSDLFTRPFVSGFHFSGRSSYRSSFNHRPNLHDQHPTSFKNMRTFPSNFRGVGMKKIEDMSTRTALISVIIIFLCSLGAMSLVYRSFPNVTEDERKHIKLPWNIEDAKQLGIVLNHYKDDHYYEVMSAVFITYIFLQTFAIPGSLFLSILSGFLFPFLVALILVCTCSMVGATLCFLLSQLLGRKLVTKYFPEKANQWAVQVEKHRHNLFNYVVFLRVTPFLPNWFINLTAPVIGVPLIPFAFGTFVGVAPPSFIAIQGGQTLHEMTAEDSTFSPQSFLWLAVFGIISLIPIFLKNRLREKLE